MWLQSVQHDLQHDFAWVTDEAARSAVVLALLQVAVLGSVMAKDWVHGVGHSPVCQIFLQIVVRAVLTFSPPAWTKSSTNRSPLAFDCTAQYSVLSIGSISLVLL